MGLSTILLLVLVVLISVYSFMILSLNKAIVNLDLLFVEVDLELGIVLLSSFLFAMVITLFLELIFYFSRKGKKSE